MKLTKEELQIAIRCISVATVEVGKSAPFAETINKMAKMIKDMDKKKTV